MSFANPLFLIALPLVIVFLFWKNRHQKPLSVRYPDLRHLKKLEDRQAKLMSRLVKCLRYFVIIGMLIALSQPRLTSQSKTTLRKGIDILLVLDVSASMLAEDLKPNRLTVAKTTIDTFIKHRTSDRIGLVVFGEDAFTVSPLTFDSQLVRSFLNEVHIGMGGQGTAIGLAIATGLNRLKHSDTKSKVMILLTDGENNAGNVDPLTAIQMAKTLGVKVYTIGVGKKGGAPVPILIPGKGKVYARNANGSLLLTQLDENMLKELAAVTGAKFFRAVDAQALTDIYREIDRLEKSSINVKKYNQFRELFPVILWVILGLMVLESLIANLFVVTVP